MRLQLTNTILLLERMCIIASGLQNTLALVNLLFCDFSFSATVTQPSLIAHPQNPHEERGQLLLRLEKLGVGVIARNKGPGIYILGSCLGNHPYSLKSTINSPIALVVTVTPSPRRT